MYESTKHIRVRYGETDKMGYVYYGNYSLYYEEGRTDAIRSLGLTYQQMEDELGILLPVIEVNMKFVLPAKYDELLTVKSILKEMPARKMRFFTEIYNEAGNLINFGTTTLMFISTDLRKSCQPPEQLIELLNPYFELKAGN